MIPRWLSATGWSFAILLGVFGSYLGLAIVVAQWIENPVVLTLTMAGVVTVLIGGIRLVCPAWLRRSAAVDHVGVVSAPRSPLRFWSLVLGVLILVFLAGQTTSVLLYTQLGSVGFDETIEHQASAGVGLMLLLTLVAAPVSEELLLRGLTYPLLRRRLGVLSSAVLTAAMFALIHGNIVQFVLAFPLGVLLAFVTEQAGRVWPAMLLHAGFNALAVVTPVAVVAGFTSGVSVVFLGLAAVSGLVVVGHEVTRGSSERAQGERSSLGVEITSSD